MDEVRGLADGSQMPFLTIMLNNMVQELSQRVPVGDTPAEPADPASKEKSKDVPAAFTRLTQPSDMRPRCCPCSVVATSKTSTLVLLHISIGCESSRPLMTTGS